MHLVLARLPDAPAGSRGISMFIVPKFKVATATAAMGERNAVAAGAIEHKMGLKGSATCVMNFDGAEGYLIGQPHKGLMAMFTMMNAARLAVGMQGLALIERALPEQPGLLPRSPADARAVRRRCSRTRPPTRSSCTRTCGACC